MLSFLFAERVSAALHWVSFLRLFFSLAGFCVLRLLLLRFSVLSFFGLGLDLAGFFSFLGAHGIVCLLVTCFNCFSGNYLLLVFRFLRDTVSFVSLRVLRYHAQCYMG